MPVIQSYKDIDALTMTMVADFDASVERVWQIWEDPRQLERWWGPPTHPATFEKHSLVDGGTSAYYMTSPEGEKYRGWWKISAVKPPHTFAFEDGFADDEGKPNDDLPTTRGVVTLETVGGLTRMTTVNSFGSLEQLEQLLAMGMQEGMTEAMGQIDALLAE
jgi:uncharacterized protein YndB with AHSA1/START domain